jgi:adenosylcobinamide-GDP ribazoletransferase
MRDAWRLAVGTLTVVPVRAPARVDVSSAALAMVLAPLAVLPLAVAVALALWAGEAARLSALATAVVAVAVLALGTRALHLDGLADTADGLTASYDRERSLAVMRTGAAGPAGVTAVVVVLLAQVAGFAALAGSDRGWLVAAVVVCASRSVLVVLCARGVPGARSDGLGASFTGTVPVAAAAAVVLVSASACVVVAGVPGLVGVVAAATVLTALVARVVRRLGGVTGDVFGAAIEATLAVLLLCLT